MTKETFIFEQKQCIIYHSEKPEYILLQPVNDHEMKNLDRQVSLIKKEISESFIFVAFLVERWNRELSPWDAPPVFGQESFGDGAGETLRFIREELIPFVTAQYTSGSDLPVVLGGYSLAGLFALWAFYELDIFTGVAACSASLWFPHWAEYVREHTIRPGSLIYLSLGMKEEKTRNAVMATVGDATRSLYREYCSDPRVAETVLEWNPGNHFTQPDERVFKGFAWLLDHNSRKNFGYKEYGKKRETNISAAEKRNAAYYEGSR